MTEFMREKYIILKVSWGSRDLADLSEKQAEINLDIIRSKWYLQDNVSRKINPKNLCASGVIDLMVVIATIKFSINIYCYEL
jgi:hypothetical protein